MCGSRVATSEPRNATNGTHEHTTHLKKSLTRASLLAWCQLLQRCFCGPHRPRAAFLWCVSCSRPLRAPPPPGRPVPVLQVGLPVLSTRSTCSTCILDVGGVFLEVLLDPLFVTTAIGTCATLALTPPALNLTITMKLATLLVASTALCATSAFGVSPTRSTSTTIRSPLTKPALVPTLSRSGKAQESALFRDPATTRGGAVPGWAAYNDALDKNPLTAKAFTSLVGWALGDLLAQVSRLVVLSFYHHLFIVRWFHSDLSKEWRGPNDRMYVHIADIASGFTIVPCLQTADRWHLVLSDNGRPTTSRGTY